MTIRRKYTLIIALLILAVNSCATFSKKNIRHEIEELNEKNIAQLNGTYSINPVRRYDNSKNNDSSIQSISDSWHQKNAYDFLLNEYSDKINEIKYTQTNKSEYQLALNFETKNKIRIAVIENSRIIRDTLLTGKCKNGMFYLDNNYLECNGIPYLFGGCSNNKRRIGLTKKGNLLINEAVSQEGAVLFIFGAGYDYNLTLEYNRY